MSIGKFVLNDWKIIFIIQQIHLGEDINGCTALFYAVTLQHSNACQVLLELKANPNHQDNRGRT
jgi:ankyrin repeat protein